MYRSEVQARSVHVPERCILTALRYQGASNWTGHGVAAELWKSQIWTFKQRLGHLQAEARRKGPLAYPW